MLMRSFIDKIPCGERNARNSLIGGEIKVRRGQTSSLDTLTSDVALAELTVGVRPSGLSSCAVAMKLCSPQIR